jgi:hypothetical protein
MCGNALGAQVEPEKHYRLTRLFPEGLQVCAAEATAGAAKQLVTMHMIVFSCMFRSSASLHAACSMHPYACRIIDALPLSLA